jgi:hypothetical protein
MKIQVHKLQAASASTLGVILHAANSTFTIAFRQTKRPATTKTTPPPTRQTGRGRAPLNPAISKALLADPTLQAILAG